MCRAATGTEDGGSGNWISAAQPCMCRNDQQHQQDRPGRHRETARYPGGSSPSYSATKACNAATNQRPTYFAQTDEWLMFTVLSRATFSEPNIETLKGSHMEADQN